MQHCQMRFSFLERGVAALISHPKEQWGAAESMKGKRGRTHGEARLVVLNERSVLEPKVAARYRSFQELLELGGSQ